MLCQRRWFVQRLYHRLKSLPRVLLGQSNKHELWTDEQMLAAAEVAQPVDKAACHHGIPKTTLIDCLSGRVTHSNLGPTLYLNSVEEDELRNSKLCSGWIW